MVRDQLAIHLENNKVGSLLCTIFNQAVTEEGQLIIQFNLKHICFLCFKEKTPDKMESSKKNLLVST